MPRFYQLLLASRNPGKHAEIRALLRPLEIDVLGPNQAGWTEEVVEDGATLEENARKKAWAAFRATGIPAVSDDTGLFVDALDGAPGVKSARYAGEEQDPVANCAKLLRALEGVPIADRGAEFRTVLALAGNGVDQVFMGACRGRIALDGRGEEGFGYDPIFEIPETGLTFAEMSANEKNQVSHRGRALVLLRQFLETSK
ncbi:MAG TPA: RdgB/HAM1 family non-canonical purine NTP pyrophosphatase [Dongiaceae bacterium]|jgi:XTP/dITP diphosphohydrolase|nr:RdgB/HAM1 family non-canonical purine NTP pyrophosphatase [Dongiaceae bacterium]